MKRHYIIIMIMNLTTEILLESTMQNMRPTLHLILLVKLMKDYSEITSLDIAEIVCFNNT